MPSKQPQFDLPGQKREAPPPLNSIRLFYESLYRQKGIKSPMATKWMLEHGLLPVELARLLDAGIWDPAKLRKVIKFNFKLKNDGKNQKKKFSFKVETN